MTWDTAHGVPEGLKIVSEEVRATWTPEQRHRYNRKLFRKTQKHLQRERRKLNAQNEADDEDGDDNDVGVGKAHHSVRSQLLAAAGSTSPASRAFVASPVSLAVTITTTLLAGVLLARFL